MSATIFLSSCGTSSGYSVEVLIALATASTDIGPLVTPSLFGNILMLGCALFEFFALVLTMSKPNGAMFLIKSVCSHLM